MQLGSCAVSAAHGVGRPLGNALLKHLHGTVGQGNIGRGVPNRAVHHLTHHTRGDLHGSHRRHIPKLRRGHGHGRGVIENRLVAVALVIEISAAVSGHGRDRFKTAHQPVPLGLQGTQGLAARRTRNDVVSSQAVQHGVAVAGHRRQVSPSCGLQKPQIGPIHGVGRISGVGRGTRTAQLTQQGDALAVSVEEDLQVSRAFLHVVGRTQGLTHAHSLAVPHVVEVEVTSLGIEGELVPKDIQL